MSIQVFVLIVEKLVNIKSFVYCICVMSSCLTANQLSWILPCPPKIIQIVALNILSMSRFSISFITNLVLFIQIIHLLLFPFCYHFSFWKTNVLALVYCVLVLIKLGCYWQLWVRVMSGCLLTYAPILHTRVAISQINLYGAQTIIVMYFYELCG